MPGDRHDDIMKAAWEALDASPVLPGQPGYAAMVRLRRVLTRDLQPTRVQWRQAIVDVIVEEGDARTFIHEDGRLQRIEDRARHLCARGYGTADYRRDPDA